ncbi:response regulator [Gimesia maris]|uniref:response regulator n=1 Tax=Gimesia maris TaxID=122 RepID=UPI00241F7A82|nr:response regulator [Gimesia maris]|tara:strand:+ start:81123 stop:81965 length:843 start_codon:yes stop_codon:yes gene_type:complete
MRLNYRIIWIDDTPTWVDSIEIKISEHLESFDYFPKIEIHDNGDTLIENCSDPDLDLIIIDYNLSHGKKGDALIKKIRDTGSFTPIVFYSQEWPSSKPNEMMDGVFRCQREDAVEKILNVIDITLHRLNDLSVIRGLVIAEAIYLEIKIEELLVLVFEEKGTLFRNKIIFKGWLDFAKKFMILKSILKDQIQACKKSDKKNELERVNEILNLFDEEIVTPRNILAHSHPIKKDNRIVLESINKQSKKIEFDSKSISQVRANLRKHKENLNSLHKILENRE